ncbi:site-specific integrase [Antribacter sp. KLBMP9083]|uniref:Site-specific integrase n=1 Tax=Antribacter soli TaxID=2910976 RepID=A0AA41QF92_9MICO|nr:tyrosine-type recombinase/integrase [Antribacter soli]MCF4122051.1 site-specific integrase [Antribacter soli]
MALERRSWGKLRKLPSGRWQAKFPDPSGALDASGRTRYLVAPQTFSAKIDAEGWLGEQRRKIELGVWSAEPPKPNAAPITFGEYAESWLAGRELATRTRKHYRGILDSHLLPEFGSRGLVDVTAAEVGAWEIRLRADLAAAAREKHVAQVARAVAAAERRAAREKRELSEGERKVIVDAIGKPKTGRTRAAHVYALAATIFNTAVQHDLIPASPCRVKGGTSAKRAKEPPALEPAELTALADAMPARLRAFVLLAGWGTLRLGELRDLRNADLTLDPENGKGVVRVHHQVQHIGGGEYEVTGPKTEAGVRDVNLPAAAVRALAAHIKGGHAAPGPDGLVFPSPKDQSKPMGYSPLWRALKAAGQKIGQPNVTVHSLRHTALTLAARTGATTAELMARGGHVSMAAALRYQHAAATRDVAIANALDALADA